MRIDKQMIETIRLHQDMTKEQALAHAADMLKKVGIPDPARVLKNYPHQLSGGMSQRVMIAMAMSCEPDLLIADEPTTALDVTIQAQILELMKKIQQDKGMSILLITHDLGVVAEMCSRVIVMYARKDCRGSSRGDPLCQPDPSLHTGPYCLCAEAWFRRKGSSQHPRKRTGSLRYAQGLPFRSQM